MAIRTGPPRARHGSVVLCEETTPSSISQSPRQTTVQSRVAWPSGRCEWGFLATPIDSFPTAKAPFESAAHKFCNAKRFEEKNRLSAAIFVPNTSLHIAGRGLQEVTTARRGRRARGKRPGGPTIVARGAASRASKPLEWILYFVFRPEGGPCTRPPSGRRSLNGTPYQGLVLCIGQRPWQTSSALRAKTR